MDITNATATANPGPITETDSIVGFKQGTSQSERVGRKCTVTNILMNINFKQANATSSSLVVGAACNEVIRCMVYWDKQCNGAAAAAVDILRSDLFNSYRNLENSGRFSILYDKTKVMNTTAIAASVASPDNAAQIVSKSWHFKINIKCFIPIEFSGSTGALTTIKSNNIGFVLWAKEGGVINLAPSVIRVRFIDL